jgi:hypothetical protein
MAHIHCASATARLPAAGGGVARPPSNMLLATGLLLAAAAAGSVSGTATGSCQS